MSVSIKLKRGTEAAIDSYAASDYEIMFASNTGKLVVFDGTNKKKYLPSDSTELAEIIADTIGSMVGSNTETMISVSYDDSDNTLDFVVDATATPTASKIPIADGSAKLDGWITTPVLATAKGAASGVASLNASTKVVEDPANATATPTASKIPIADGSAKLDGWITTPVLATAKGAASGVASLNASTKVVEDPANATATPTASKIPIADADGILDSWITPAIFDLNADQLDIDYTPVNYIRTAEPGAVLAGQLGTHLKGIDVVLGSILARLTAHSI